MITTFLGSVINRKLFFCAVLVLDNYKQNQMSINGFISSVSTQVKYTLSFTESVSLNDSQKRKFNSNLKLSNPCLLTVCFLENLDTKFLKHVESIIAPDFMPLAKKDYDYFIFMVPQCFHAELLLSNDFVKRMKFKLAVSITKTNELQLTTVDFFKHGGLPQLVILGNDSANFFPDFVQNCRQKTVYVSIPGAKALIESYAPTSPFDVENGKRGPWKYLLEEYLMGKFNFTYQMFPSTGGGTGRQLKGGGWTGVTGDLVNRQADFGIGIANTDKRIKVIGFTDSFVDTACLTFVTNQPGILFSTRALLWPLHFDLWIGLVVITFTTLLTTVLLTKPLQRVNLEKASINPFSQILLVMAPLLEQDGVYVPRSHTLRSLITFWYFFVLILTNLYRSKLVTLLAFPFQLENPQTFRDLAFSNFQIGFMKDGDSAYNTISNGKDPVYAKLLRKMEILKGVNLDCLEKVLRSSNYGCIAYDADVSYLIQKNFTDESAKKLQISKAQTYNIWMGLATQPQSIFRVNFDKVLRQIRPFHLHDIWFKKDNHDNIRQPKIEWWKKTNQTQYLNSTSGEKMDTLLSMNNIEGVFYLYVCLIVGSAILFVGEVLNHF